MNTQNAKMYFVIKMQRIGSSNTINIKKKVIEKQFTLTILQMFHYGPIILLIKFIIQNIHESL